MPEKTRDRKNWFPRFKSNWLGTYRSKQMFVCCECAVTDAESARYKGAEGKHCLCGRDQWHLAKQIEEAEYNRRMEISKSFGGVRYEEAVERIRAAGGSELEYDDSRVRCESDESTASTASVSSTDSVDHYRRIKPESLSPASRAAAGGFTHELQLSMASSVYPYDQHQHHQQAYQPTKYASTNHANYTPLGVEMLSSSPYDHLAPPAFTDEESFGELLQGILEDDPRNAGVHAKMQRAAPYAPYAHMKQRYAAHPQDHHNDMEFGFYQQHHHQQQHHQGYNGYYPTYPPQQPSMVPSFPSAV